MQEIIELPKDVEASVADRKITVKGARGTLEKDFDDPRYNYIISFGIEGGRFVVSARDDRRKTRAMANTIAAHTRNMIRGVQSGYRYTLRIVYTHFPLTVGVEKGEVRIKNFLGEKGARIARIRGNAKVDVEKETVVVSGPSIEDVAQTAANIEKACKLKGRDRRTFQDGIYIESKHLQTGEAI